MNKLICYLSFDTTDEFTFEIILPIFNEVNNIPTLSQRVDEVKKKMSSEARLKRNEGSSRVGIMGLEAWRAILLTETLYATVR